MLFEFCKYFAEIDFDKTGISLRQTKLVRRDPSTDPKELRHRAIAIEDPCQPVHNLARSTSPESKSCSHLINDLGKRWVLDSVWSVFCFSDLQKMKYALKVIADRMNHGEQFNLRPFQTGNKPCVIERKYQGMTAAWKRKDRTEIARLRSHLAEYYETSPHRFVGKYETLIPGRDSYWDILDWSKPGETKGDGRRGEGGTHWRRYCNVFFDDQGWGIRG